MIHPDELPNGLGETKCNIDPCDESKKSDKWLNKRVRWIKEKINMSISSLAFNIPGMKRIL